MATYSVTFPMNSYLTTDGITPYPILNSKVDTITNTGFKNVLDFGAKGDGVTADDTAIVNTFIAAQNASTGVYFPPNKTYLLQNQNTINISKDITVWAYNATVKMKDLNGYAMFKFVNNANWTHNFIWLGGTVDGNQFNQVWPGNPHGGIYDGPETGGSGNLIELRNFDFTLFKDVDLRNNTVTGVVAINCRIGMYDSDTAANGAGTGSQGGTAPQGTYFKVRGEVLSGDTKAHSGAFYANNVSCNDGQFALQYSTPNFTTPDGSVTSIRNCTLLRPKGSVHFEDCRSWFVTDSHIEGDANAARLLIHSSDETYIGVVKNCTIKYGFVNFHDALQKIAIVDTCSFTAATNSLTVYSDYGLSCQTNLVSVCNTFTGAYNISQCDGRYVRNCSFTNFGATAITTGYGIDASQFTNGTRPANLVNGGFVTTSCTFTNISNPNTKTANPPAGWDAIFSSIIDIFNDNSVLLGTVEPSSVCGNTTFYISNTGDDSKNGTSPATAWKTLKSYLPGNTYLFNRGDTFYPTVPARTTTSSTPITISAYGTGAKPILSQYTTIVSGWILTTTNNVWKVDLTLRANVSGYLPVSPDAGNVGFLKVNGVINPNKKSGLNQLSQQWDFFSDNDKTLFVWSQGRPSTVAASILCNTHSNGSNIVTISNWMTISNVQLIGSGGSALNGLKRNNVNISNLTVSEIGGCYLVGTTEQFGQAIALSDGATNVVIDGCDVSQAYQAGITIQSHQSNPIPFTNITVSNNTVHNCLSGFNPSIESGIPSSNGFVNCRVTGNTFTDMGFVWSHDIAPDAQSVAWLNNFWNTTQTDIILENNTIINPRTAVYFLSGTLTDPRFTTRNNNICIDPNILIRRNCNGCIPDKFPYTLTGNGTPNNYAKFVADEGYEKGSTWSSYSGGVCTPYSSLAGTYKTGTSSSTVCSQPNVTLYTKGAFAVGKTLYTDSGTTTAKTGATFVVQVSTNKIFHISTAGVIGSDTGLTCQSGTAGTYRTGTTLTTVCSQQSTTLYTSGAFAGGKTLYTDANLSTIKTGASFVVTVSNNHIWTISNAGVIGSDTGNICNSGTGATYIVGNTLVSVCSGSPVTLYTSGAFAIGKTLFSDINLLIKETGFLYVVQSSTNHIFNLDSSTAVVGSDTGSVCSGGTGATYKVGNTLTTVCSAANLTLYTSGGFNIGDTLYTDINLTIKKTGFDFVVQVSTNHIFNLDSTTAVVGTDTGDICNSGTAGNYITGNTLSTVCSGTAETLYTSGAFAEGGTLYSDINLLIPKTGFAYVVQSSTQHVFELASLTGVIGSDTGTVCGEVPVDCSTSTREKYGIYGLGLISNLTQFNAFLPSMQGFHFRFAWTNYETAAGVFDASYLINQLKIAFNNCLYTGLEMFVAPQSNVTPAYVFAPPYNVPSVGTNAATDNTFPYYFYKNASNVFQFKQRYQNLNTQFRSDIAEAAAWSAQWQGRMLFMLSAEGYRGDENPYNGTPVNSSFAITEASWNTYKQTEVWNVFYAAVNTSLSFLHPMINQANDNSSFIWGLNNTPNAWFKAGEFGQVYNFSNEKNYAALLISLKTSGTNNNRVGAELEATTTNAAWWTTSPSLNIMAIVCSALHSGVDILAIRPADAITTTTAYDFFNKYAGLRNATDSNIGFCALRDVVDLANLNRFSEVTYGTLVASSDQATYNTQFNAINASGLPGAQIQYQLTHLLTSGKAGVPYVNAARITNIRAAFPTASYQAINNDTPTTIQSYTQDFGVNMIAGNYNKFVTQFSPNSTSVGVWRVTSVSDFWGRFGRRTDFATSKNELFFTINTGLAVNNNYRVTIKVTYLSNGGGTWTLNYFNATAKVSAGSTTNGATAVSAQKTFTINDFQGGGNLSNATDFSLLRTAGADCTFFAVELTVVSQNTTGTAGTYVVGNTLSTVCAGSPVTLFTDGAFAIGQILYSDIILLTPETGFSFVVNTATNHVYNLDTSNGQVGTDTGSICGGGTAGVYKTATLITSVCAAAATTLYTSGSFAVGKTLYTDINLTTKKTGASFVVTTSDNHIYNLNTSSGLVGSDTGNICNSGTAGSYILGTVLSTVCDGSATTLYTSGSFAVGKTLYTDVNLLTAQTGFTFVVTTTNSHVFNLNNSGVVGSDTGIICNSGTAGNYILGNNSGTVCAGTPVTRYTSGSFAVSKILYTTNDLTTPVTGFTFVVFNNEIYNINTSTGQITSDTTTNCTGTGISGTYKLNTTAALACAAGNTTLYTDGAFAIGGILYTDAGLTTPETGFTFVVDTSTSNIYGLDSSTGVIGSQVGICNGGTSGTYRVGNTLSTVCSQTTGTLYTNGAFAVNKTLYTDINLTTNETGFIYVEETVSDHVYNLDTSTGVVGSDTGIVCGSGTSGTYKLGIDITTVCGNTNSTLYTSGAFNIGDTLYTDVNLTLKQTGFSYVVEVGSNHVFDLDIATGVVGQDTGIICGSGTSGTYKLGNVLTTVCNQGDLTLYTSGIFAVGGTLYTDINLTIPATGFTLVVRGDTSFVYNLDTGSGVIGSRLNNKCGSGKQITGKKN